MSNDVSYEVFFCAVSLSGTMRSAMSVLLEETAFGGHASLEPADPEHCRFSRTSHGYLSTFCDTHGPKVPAFLRDWQELDAEQAAL